MHPSLPAWKSVLKALDEKSAIVLLYVLESKGSSPGRQGFFMTVASGGEMKGTIGGGIMEHKFVELAKEQLQTEGGKPQAGSLKKQVHDKLPGSQQSGMICSGEQTIWIYSVQSSERSTIQSIINSLEKNENGTLVLSPGGISFTEGSPENNYHFARKSEGDWQYTERTGFKQNLFIIGGGHCSLALSRLMSTMDFYIRVYDDRQELKTIKENSYAHEKYLIKDYEELGRFIPDGKNNYVVIMTFGYRTDDIAIRALAGKKFAYLGVLGSATKIKRLFDEYGSSGISQEWLDSVHSPIGISIRSQTSDEIAVSIAAEIIREKNKHVP